MKLNFGKYGPKNFPPNGISIEFVNSGYLKWLIDEDWFLRDSRNELLCCAIEEELKLRDMNNDHFYQDKVKPQRLMRSGRTM